MDSIFLSFSPSLYGILVMIQSEPGVSMRAASPFALLPDGNKKLSAVQYGVQSEALIDALNLPYRAISGQKEHFLGPAKKPGSILDT